MKGHKNGSIQEKMYQTHIIRKSEARQQEEKDKIDCQEEEKVLVFAVDHLQAVLFAPRLNTVAKYYKTKLKVHNWTHYNFKNKAVPCFVWHENQGGLESDIFAFIATKFLKQQITKHNPRKIKFGAMYAAIKIETSSGPTPYLIFLRNC